MENKYNPVGWFEIYVDDMERARKFYEAVFQCQLSELPDPSGQGLKMSTFPLAAQTSGAAGALVYFEGMKAGGNSTLVYFTSEDCAVEEGRVAEAGGTVFRPKMSIGAFGFISLCFDSERNMFGIHSQK